MARIGIVTCSNTTQDMGCSSVGCLADLRSRGGHFEHYPKDAPLELIGIVSCAGCPTIVGAEKILDRIRGLVAVGVEAIHLAACVVHLCPFKKRYEDVIRQRFPHLSVVAGTHAPPPGMDEAQMGEFFKTCVKETLHVPRKTIVETVMEKMTPQPGTPS
ncbi:MAG: CGGC domain-containing protein [Candidatus Riflebacteria bacterium]|nr:CGGC domain-containing protein [Candidatus Riflebacteria bacterium]